MSKRKLLLADDSTTIQKVVNLTFADEGIDVITVGDGDSAITKIAEVSPDIVLADVHMPGLSGYQICEILRGDPTTRSLPVVLLVGSFEPFDEAEAERVGANAYLTKPFQSIRQLVSQVSDLLEAKSESADVQAPADDTVEHEAAAVEDEVRVEPGTNDIDHLYHQSLAERDADPGETYESDYSASVEMAEVEEAPAPFVDAGMDDEMIEARHADDQGDGIEAMSREFATEEYTESESAEIESAAGDSDAAESQNEQAAPSPFDSLATPGSDAPSALESRDDETYFDQFANTEQIPASELVQGFELDEIELLELPPLENGKTLEFTTTERMAAMGEKKQVVSLSPELMDVIVKKVVEKLSEKY